MASSPVLEQEQPENQLVSNPKQSRIFEDARGVVWWVTYYRHWEAHHRLSQCGEVQGLDGATLLEEEQRELIQIIHKKVLNRDEI